MYGPDKKQRAEFYRHEAEKARQVAAKASTPVMRDEYLKLAAEWDRLAGIPREHSDH